MNMNRLRAAGIIAAGALLLSTMAPTAALADYDPDQKDIGSCNGDCTGWGYTESSSYIFDGRTRTLGAEAPTCPNAEELTRATGGTSETIGKDWSWTEGQGADANFLGVIGANLSRSSSYGVSSSVTTSTSFTFVVPRGKMGAVTFTPKMYHSEGLMNWTEHYYNETHDTNEWHDFVTSNTPMTVDSGAAAGTYDIAVRDMRIDELNKCGIRTPPADVPAPPADVTTPPADVPAPPADSDWTNWEILHPIMDRPLEPIIG